MSQKEKNSGADLSEDGEDGFDGGYVVDVVLGVAVMVYGRWFRDVFFCFFFLVVYGG